MTSEEKRMVICHGERGGNVITGLDPQIPNSLAQVLVERQLEGELSLFHPPHLVLFRAVQSEDDAICWIELGLPPQ